ncbi:hypothetical protein PIROE2DRAFT_10264, partial [Piromyces sp. E2]
MKFNNFKNILLTTTIFGIAFGDNVNEDKKSLYDITCIEDNVEICDMYSSVLNKIVNKYNEDLDMNRNLHLEIFVDNIAENGYSDSDKLVELNTNFEDLVSGNKYPKYEEMTSLIGQHDVQNDFILVFDNFKKSEEVDAENIKQLVENSIRNVIIGSNVVEEKQYNKRYFNEEEEENENEIVDKEILFDLNCIEDNNEVCDVYKNAIHSTIFKFNEDLTINRELKLEVFIDSITDNGYSKEVQLAELNEKFEDLLSGTQYPKHEEMAGYIDGQFDYILVFDNFKNSEIDSENIKKLVENSIRNVIIGSNVVEEKQYNKRYFNEEEEKEENEIVDKEILFDLNCIEDNNEVCDIYKNAIHSTIFKFNEDLTINRELKLEVFIDSITDNGYSDDVQLAELNEKFEDLVSGTQYPKHEEMAGYIDGQVDYILVFDNFKNGEIDSENVKQLVENSIRNVIIGSNVVEEKQYNKRYFNEEEEEEETVDKEILFDLNCIEDNDEVCDIYKNELSELINKFNEDLTINRELKLEVFVDSITDNGYTDDVQLAELNEKFEDLVSGTQYPKHEEMAGYIDGQVDYILVFDNFKNSEIDSENVKQLVENSIRNVIIGSNVVEEKQYNKRYFNEEEEENKNEIVDKEILFDLNCIEDNDE